LPSESEYEMLDKAVGGKDVAGKKLKAKSGWNDYEGKSGNGTDEYGFSALPGGMDGGGSDGRSVAVGEFGYWWGAKEYVGKEYGVMNVWHRYIGRGYNGTQWNNTLRSQLFSVRCLQD